MASLAVGAAAAATAIPGFAQTLLPPLPLPSGGATATPAGTTTAATPSSPASTTSPPCSPAPAQANAWSTVFSIPDPFLDKPTPSVPATYHGAEISVDPWYPCRIYRSLRDHVERSNDGGKHWTTIFQDPSGSNPASTGGAVAATGYDSALFGPVIPVAPNHAFLVDQGGDEGIFYSPDAGASWAARSSGLVTAPYLTTVPLSPSYGIVAGPVQGDTGIRAEAFAPSDPATGYVISSVGGETLLFRTTDGGQHWAPATVPQTELDTLAVDPDDPQHVMVAGGGGWTATGTPSRFVNASTPATAKGVWESADGGTTWRLLPGPGGETPYVLALTRVPDAARGRILHIYAGTLGTLGGTNVGRAYLERYQSVDGGSTWTQLPLPVPFFDQELQQPIAPFLLVDPEHPLSMMWVAVNNGFFTNRDDSVAIDVTTDGFATSSRMEFAENSPGAIYTLHGSVDRFHNFYVGESFGAGLPQKDLLRVLHLDPSSTLPGTRDLGLVPTRSTCTLDPIAPQDMNAQARAEMEQQNPDTGQAADPYWNGSLTYDGRYLDYTQDDLAPGVLYRIDPATCTSAPPLRLAPPPAGSGYVGEWAVPALEALTYDPSWRFASGHTGAILARGHRDSNNTLPASAAPVYAVDPQTAAYTLAFPVACSPFRDFHLCDYPTGLAYDVHRAAIWTAYFDPNRDESGLTLEKATPATTYQKLPTCVAGIDWGNPRAEPFGPEAGGAEMWTTGGRNVLYAQNSDDESIYTVDSSTCAVTSGFRHAPWKTADEHIQQMACDPVSFGSGSGAASVLWLRNSLANTVAAYPIPDNHCPFPTTLNLLPTATAAANSTAQVCATLAAASSPARPLAGQTVSFTVAGTTTAQPTQPDGTACVLVPTGAATSTLHVRATFAGNDVYLPATDSGVLDVVAAPVTTLTPPPPATPKTPHPPAPAPVPAPPAAPVEVLPAPQPPPPTTSQTQPNPQTALQPGLMEQPQQRQQFAAQGADSGEAPDIAYQATASRSTRDATPWAPAALAGIALLALATLLRRPREAAAAHQHHRRAAPPAAPTTMAQRRRRGLL